MKEMSNFVLPSLSSHTASPLRAHWIDRRRTFSSLAKENNIHEMLETFWVLSLLKNQINSTQITLISNCRK